MNYLPVRNTETVAVPPFALMRVTGVDDEGRMTVSKPDADGQTDLLVNGPSAIPAEGGGVGHQTFPAIVAYSADIDPFTAPEAGETWGVRAGDWFLHAGQTGFRILGGAGEGLVNVSRADIEEPTPPFPGITVRDDTTTVTGVSEVVFLPDGAVTVADEGDGVASVELNNASGTVPGIVSLSAQTMGDGDKTFRDAVLVNDDRYAGSGLSSWNSKTIFSVLGASGFSPLFNVVGYYTSGGLRGCNTYVSNYLVIGGAGDASSGGTYDDHPSKPVATDGNAGLLIQSTNGSAATIQLTGGDPRLMLSGTRADIVLAASSIESNTHSISGNTYLTHDILFAGSTNRIQLALRNGSLLMFNVGGVANPDTNYTNNDYGKTTTVAGMEFVHGVLYDATGYAPGPPSGSAGGSLAGTYPNPTLSTTGVSAATYGSATQVPQIAVSTEGRITSASNVTITGVTPGGSAGGDLTGTYPNPTLAATAVAAGSYGSATQVGTFTVDSKGRLTAAGNTTIAVVPTGTILLRGSGGAPTGYLACDGSAVSRTTYADLFGVLGTAFGNGDASTTFNVPDFRGRAPIGSGTGTGLTARSIGGTVGTETHVLTTAELASHTHGFATATLQTAAGAAQSACQSGGAAQTGAAGSNNAHNNMQPSLVVNFIIKT